MFITEEHQQMLGLSAEDVESLNASAEEGAAHIFSLAIISHTCAETMHRLVTGELPYLDRNNNVKWCEYTMEGLLGALVDKLA